MTDDKIYFCFDKLTIELQNTGTFWKKIISDVASVLIQTLSYCWKATYPQTSPWTRLPQTSCDSHPMSTSELPAEKQLLSSAIILGVTLYCVWNTVAVRGWTPPKYLIFFYCLILDDPVVNVNHLIRRKVYRKFHINEKGIK